MSADPIVDSPSPGPGLSVRAILARPNEPSFSLDVAFDAPPGITILFGPSGSGKSTTLAAIAGLIRPSRGRITLGADVWYDGDAGINVPAHQRRVAFVFQSLALFPHMTAAQNVAYGMDRALHPREKRARADALFARLRVSHVADRKPSTLSGGEAQRVALARALGMTPRVVLLDEPFNALDRELRRELVTEVRTIVRDLEVPVIVVTHERAEATALGERLVRLDGGRVAGVGAAGDLGHG